MPNLPDSVRSVPFCRDVSPFDLAQTIQYPADHPYAQDVLLLPLTRTPESKALFGHSKSFTADIPGKSLGYELPVEMESRNSWRQAAATLSVMLSTFTVEVRAKAYDLATSARRAFDEIRDIYEEHAESIGIPINGLNQFIPLSVPDGQIQADPGYGLTLVARVKARKSIRELYNRGAHLLWCALYLGALSAAKRKYDDKPEMMDLAPAPATEPILHGNFYNPQPGEPFPDDQVAPTDAEPAPANQIDPVISECDPLQLPPDGFMCVADADGVFRMVQVAAPVQAPSKMVPIAIGGIVVAGALLMMRR